MATSRKKTRATDEISAGNNGSVGQNTENNSMEQDMVENSDSSFSDSEESDDDGMEVEEKVNVEFEARNPEEMDFHGIRQLLLQLFLKSNIDLSTLADLILNQKHVGSVIKQYLGDEIDEDEEEDDDVDANQVYGVISCINITKHKDEPCIGQMKKHMIEKLAGEPQAAKELQAIFDNTNNNIGYIVNERFVNIPAQIAEPSFASLSHEMQEANSKGEDYKCTHFLMMAKKFKMKMSGKAGKKRRSKRPLDPEIYSNAEEELFAEAAEFKASYTVAGERDSGVVQQWDSELEDQYEPIREVIVFKADRLPQILSKIHEYLAQPNS